MDTSSEYKELSSKIDNLNDYMKSVLEVNQALLKQNLKLSNQVLGQVKEPENNCNNFIGSNKKDLYYECVDVDENVYIISGPGTYDNKEDIKSLSSQSEWKKDSKGWQVSCPLKCITDKFEFICEKPC